MKRRHEDFILRPTNTFGQFESPLSPVISQYIRIAQETKFEQIDNLFFTIWQLPKPQLVLTFYGTDPKSMVLTKLLQRSLGMITRQTHGKLGGTAELVAQAIRGYTEAYGMKELQVIGLTPWALLTNAQLLSSDDFLVRILVSFTRRGHSQSAQFATDEKGLLLKRC
ncbi:unnamed protein product [Dibothriocephalus latus]|uniref:TRPM SLOG domain-containing protein n=1 Tax=Dibothriocephalus latus TaxID=60516 RepID=A0A3P7L303_DIBLA|nr:unnamed protein product [Dibothriocephalus latus]